MYRDDLEAAQARADALERETEDLRAKNAELELRATATATTPQAPAKPARVKRVRGARRSGSNPIGWVLVAFALAAMFFGGRLGLSPGLEGAGLVLTTIALIVGLSLVDPR